MSVHDSGIWETDVERSICVSQWSLSMRASIARSLFVSAAPLCCERYQPTQGQSAAAFCSLCKEISQIPEMNTCAGVELHRWFKTHNQICTQKHTRDLQTQYTQCAWKNTVSTTHFICWAGTVWHILEIIFLINTPQELYYGGFFVNSSGSRSRTQNEIYGHAVKKMSALFLLHYSVWFIPNCLSHLVAAVEFEKMTGGIKGRNKWQNNEKSSCWQCFPTFVTTVNCSLRQRVLVWYFLCRLPLY